ncbi:hypothetical protein [Lysinibacillus sp. G4S2]|uniref:hypothetical protein n=1 Tax=Lysinibacillus sp. G4S2 TaxID=3055859 RepID=UPI0025A1B03A|nr:hypothetical protein [Lysinibacillus sp. G4S2]MDM5248489.1 hypothetical protein [Lysinibacillus sp. G4S2]
METNLHERLKDIIPDNIELTTQKKEGILSAAHDRFVQQQQPVKKHGWKPVVVGVSALALTILLSYPFIEDGIEQLIVSQVTDRTYEEISIPGRSTETLFTAIFDDATNSFFYYEGGNIYSYAIDTQIEKVEMKGESPISKILVNENWLVWMGDGKEEDVFVKNRETLEVKEFSTSSFIDLDDDILLTDKNDTKKGQTIYSLTNLRTNEVKQYKQFFDNSSVSQPIYQDNQLLIPEVVKKDGEEVVRFTLYDVGTEKEKQYELPFKGTLDIALTDQKIYASFKNGKSLETGYVDLVDGSYHKIDGKKAFSLAVYKNKLALNEFVPNEDKSRFKLYKVEDGSLSSLPDFKDVQLVLFNPRFTKEGTLQLFGVNEKYILEDGTLEERDGAVKLYLQRF